MTTFICCVCHRETRLAAGVFQPGCCETCRARDMADWEERNRLIALAQEGPSEETDTAPWHCLSCGEDAYGAHYCRKCEEERSRDIDEYV